jgi:hypothetical protein
MLHIFVKQRSKGNKHPQTVQDHLLKIIFLEDYYRELKSFNGSFTVTDTLNELLLAKYNVGQKLHGNWRQEVQYICINVIIGFAYKLTCCREIKC